MCLGPGQARLWWTRGLVAPVLDPIDQLISSRRTSERHAVSARRRPFHAPSQGPLKRWVGGRISNSGTQWALGLRPESVASPGNHPGHLCVAQLQVINALSDRRRPTDGGAGCWVRVMSSLAGRVVFRKHAPERFDDSDACTVRV